MAPSTAPSEVQPSAPKKSPLLSGKSLLSSSISIKSNTATVPKIHTIQSEVRPLTQEYLNQLWVEAGKELGLSELLSKGLPRMSEHTGQFVVEATTTYFFDDFRPKKMEVLQYIRRQTGMQLLDCKVIPLYVEKDALPYSAEEKYRAMYEINPAIAKLKKVFPEIEM